MSHSQKRQTLFHVLHKGTVVDEWSHRAGLYKLPGPYKKDSLSRQRVPPSYPRFPSFEKPNFKRTCSNERALIPPFFIRWVSNRTQSLFDTSNLGETVIFVICSTVIFKPGLNWVATYGRPMASLNPNQVKISARYPYRELCWYELLGSTQNIYPQEPPNPSSIWLHREKFNSFRWKRASRKGDHPRHVGKPTYEFRKNPFASNYGIQKELSWKTIWVRWSRAWPYLRQLRLVDIVFIQAACKPLIYLRPIPKLSNIAHQVLTKSLPFPIRNRLHWSSIAVHWNQPL